MEAYDTTFDLKFEQAVAAEWEKQNIPEIDGETLRQAARSLNFAIEELDKACDSVNEAAETLVDTTEGDRVFSILKDMENLLADLKAMKSTYEQGVTK